MSPLGQKKSSYAKAYVLLGIGAGVGIGLCSVAGLASDSSQNSGFTQSAFTIAFSLGTLLFWLSILGIVILSVILLFISLSGANRE